MQWPLGTVTVIHCAARVCQVEKVFNWNWKHHVPSHKLRISKLLWSFNDHLVAWTRWNNCWILLEHWLVLQLDQQLNLSPVRIIIITYLETVHVESIPETIEFIMVWWDFYMSTLDNIVISLINMSSSISHTAVLCGIK